MQLEYNVDQLDLLYENFKKDLLALGKNLSAEKIEIDGKIL